MSTIMRMMGIFKLKSPYWKAVGIIFGMIVGSGIFALPYAVNISGVLWSAIAGLAAFFAVLSIHIAYGEVVSNTNEPHRLPGYVGAHLGKLAGNVEKVSQFLGFNTALAIYGALGGIFLSMIFGASPLVWTVIFFAVGSVIFFFGNSDKIGFLDFILTIPLIATVLYLSFLSFSKGQFSNISFFGRDPFFSFSIFVFSLTGLSVIADAKEFFKSGDDVENASSLKSAITVGTAVPFFLYIIFVFSVLMASGSAVTKDTLSGLSAILGRKIIVLGGVIGFLGTFTSYLALGHDLKKIYEIDMGIKRALSWLAVFLIPLLVFIFSGTNFVKLISLVGGIFISVDGLFVIFTLSKMRKIGMSRIHFLEFGKKYQLFLSAIFILSIIYEVFHQIF